MKNKKLSQDFQRNFPKGLRSIFNLFQHPGIISIFIYRYNHFATNHIHNRFLKLPCLIIGLAAEKIYGDVYGIHISRHAKFGGGLKISHFGSIFINNGVVGGENVTICKGVSIGVSGHGNSRGAPIVGDNCYIGQNAIIHGRIRIGNNVKIGPNATVFFDIPDDSIVFAPKPQVQPINKHLIE